MSAMHMALDERPEGEVPLPPSNGTLSAQGREAAQEIVFGSIAGVLGKVLEFPFDTIKVRLQSQPDGIALKYKGPFDCFKKSCQRDGVQWLYRGISAPMFGAAVETSSLFFSYRVAQDVLKATVLPKADPLPMSALVFCGAVSGAVTSTVLTPIELVKCKMQVPLKTSMAYQQSPTIRSILASVYRHQGISGFWHGHTGTLIRETGGSAAWFGTKEILNDRFRTYRSLGAKDSLPILDQMASGAAAGMFYNFIFYPADTIKSRMQTESVTGGKSRFWPAAKSLFKQHGIKGLYRGCGLTVARAAPSSAVIFTAFDYLSSRFGG